MKSILLLNNESLKMEPEYIIGEVKVTMTLLKELSKGGFEETIKEKTIAKRVVEHLRSYIQERLILFRMYQAAWLTEHTPTRPRIEADDVLQLISLIFAVNKVFVSNGHTIIDKTDSGYADLIRLV